MLTLLCTQYMRLEFYNCRLLLLPLQTFSDMCSIFHCIYHCMIGLFGSSKCVTCLISKSCIFCLSPLFGKSGGIWCFFFFFHSWIISRFWSTTYIHHKHIHTHTYIRQSKDNWFYSKQSAFIAALLVFRSKRFGCCCCWFLIYRWRDVDASKQDNHSNKIHLNSIAFFLRERIENQREIICYWFMVHHIHMRQNYTYTSEVWSHNVQWIACEVHW